MNRVIKFRAWDDLNKIWIKNFCITSDGEFLIETDECEYRITTPYAIIQQFTGLLDKNGKEIYEGDLIMLTNVIGIERGPFEVKQERFEVEGNEYFGYSWYGYLIHEPNTPENLDRNAVEVIGNIYETPHTSLDPND